MSDVLYLINPKSNEGRAMAEWKKVREKYPQAPEKPLDVLQIKDLTAHIKEHNPKVVAVMGGDGTINETCKAILPLKQKPAIAILPMGFGNAMAYSLGVDTIEKAFYVLQHRPAQVTVDLLKTNLPEHPIGMFNISIGFDARIVFNRMNQRYIGYRSYILSGIRSFFSHSENRMKFTIDHSVNVTAIASSLVIANSPVIGQNVVVADRARLNDGFLDCTIFSTKITYLTNLRLGGFKHPLYSNKGKVQFKAKHIRVEGEPYVQVDGDPVVLKAPLEVEIVPGSITFLANDNEHISIPYASYLEK